MDCFLTVPSDTALHRPIPALQRRWPLRNPGRGEKFKEVSGILLGRSKPVEPQAQSRRSPVTRHKGPTHNKCRFWYAWMFFALRCVVASPGLAPKLENRILEQAGTLKSAPL
jgi:hypothetical protein